MCFTKTSKINPKGKNKNTINSTEPGKKSENDFSLDELFTSEILSIETNTSNENLLEV